jgi:hypothetical protein
MSTSLRLAFLLTIAVLFAPEAALAYGGPGSVISGSGRSWPPWRPFWATLFGFIWFPLKRLYKSWAEEETPAEEATANQTTE